MKWKIFNNFIVLFGAFSVVSCQMDPHGPSPYNISGTVVFTDTVFKPTGGGYFAVAVFLNNTNDLLHGVPVKIQQLNPHWNGSNYIAEFSVGEFNGTAYHYLAATWIRTPYNSSDTRPILGTYGCGIEINCTSFIDVDWINNHDIFFNAQADTSKRVFYNDP
jgi:hypothetical protein